MQIEFLIFEADNQIMTVMPRGGARKGAGRKRGTSARTLALNALAGEVNGIEQRKAKPLGLGIDVLRDLLAKCIALAEYYEPSMTGEPNPHADADRHERWCSYIRMCAAELTKYESPRLATVMVAPAPELPDGTRKKFTLTVFESPRRLIGAPVIEHESNGAEKNKHDAHSFEVAERDANSDDELLDDFGRKLPLPE